MIRTVKKLSLYAAILLMIVSLASIVSAQQSLPTHLGVCDNLCGSDPLCQGQIIGAPCGDNGVCDSGCGCVPTFFCNDADDSRACCDLIGNGQWEWGKSGEESPIGGFTDQVTEECIGDDQGEFFRFRQCSGSTCRTDPTDVAACGSGASCVFEGICFGDIDEVIVTESDALVERIKTHSLEFEDDFEQLFDNIEERVNAKKNFGQNLGDERHKKILKAAIWNSDFRRKVYKDVDENALTEAVDVCDPGFWGPADGIVVGVVRNATHPIVPGVTITLFGSPLIDVTDEFGEYELLNVPAGSYSISASKPEDGYVDDVANNVEVPGFGSVTQNFALGKPSLGCNNDCTKADGLCHAECEGKALCSFETPEIQSACDRARPGLLTNPADPDQKIRCCTGPIFTPQPANVQVCGENAVVARQAVTGTDQNLGGETFNIVMITFDASSCIENIQSI